MKKKLVMIPVCLLLLILLLVGGFIGIKFFFLDKTQQEAENTSATDAAATDDGELFLEPINAEEYLDEIGEVKTKTDVSASEAVMTGGEVIEFLTERGFGECPVETNYSMNGEYYESEKISQDSTEKHPIYETYFVSSAESMWYIEIVNGSIYASLFSYDLQENQSVPVIISETEYITSYDSATNQFFEVIPDPSEFVVEVVPKIDAELLEDLTVEGDR